MPQNQKELNKVIVTVEPMLPALLHSPHGHTSPCTLTLGLDEFSTYLNVAEGGMKPFKGSMEKLCRVEQVQAAWDGCEPCVCWRDLYEGCSPGRSRTALVGGVFGEAVPG
ncbi:hypothetical protein MC885_001134 [Smutsia gigantea]|nr:hypothetical protein MC885_001134 [Smutsia gigantea]